MKEDYKLIPVTRWEDTHQWPTESALRHYIFNAKNNGFDRVIRRVGKRILINEKEFYEWVESSNKINKKS